MKGDVQGGSHLGLSGVIEAGALPSVTIQATSSAATALSRGAVIGDSSVGKVTVDGDIRAGTGFESGVVLSHGSIGSVTVQRPARRHQLGREWGKTAGASSPRVSS